MISKPGSADRQILDLQNAESASAWVMFFVTKCRAAKKGEKISAGVTLVDIQITNPFLVCAGKMQLQNLGAQ